MDDLQLILGLDSSNQSELRKLELSKRFAESLVCSYIKESVIPELLGPVVDEITLMRYSRFGSEAVSSETVDSVSQSYHSDYLTPFYSILDEYKSTAKKKVVFL